MLSGSGQPPVSFRNSRRTSRTHFEYRNGAPKMTSKTLSIKKQSRRRAATTVQIIDPSLVIALDEPPPSPPPNPSKKE